MLGLREFLYTRFKTDPSDESFLILAELQKFSADIRISRIFAKKSWKFGYVFGTPLWIFRFEFWLSVEWKVVIVSNTLENHYVY